MSNSRAMRRRIAKTGQPKPRFPRTAPSLGSVRRWMKQLEDEGAIERKGAERTGKPGRPAQLWGLTEAEKKRLGGRRREVPKMPCGCMAWPGREFCAHNPAPADAQGGSW